MRAVRSVSPSEQYELRIGKHRESLVGRWAAERMKSESIRGEAEKLKREQIEKKV